MNVDDNSSRLIAKVAHECGLPPSVLESLLALESSYANFAAPGARADFARQVARIVEDEAATQGAL
jgi:hypothetical protein